MKTANPTQITVGETVTYTFDITNLSTFESFTLLSLDDDKFGDIVDADDCDLSGVVLAPSKGAAGGNDETTWQIDRVLTEAPGSTHTNVAPVTGADDEILANLALPAEEQDDSLTPVSDSDDAEVFTLTPATTADKTVRGNATLAANGMWTTIIYDVVVTNTGAGVGVIDLDDKLRFGGDGDIESVGATTVDGAAPNADFDGVAASTAGAPSSSTAQPSPARRRRPTL